MCSPISDRKLFIVPAEVDEGVDHAKRQTWNKPFEITANLDLHCSTTSLVNTNFEVVSAFVRTPSTVVAHEVGGQHRRLVSGIAPINAEAGDKWNKLRALKNERKPQFPADFSVCSKPNSVGYKADFGLETSRIGFPIATPVSHN